MTSNAELLLADWAVASLRFRARGEDSGVEVDMRFGMAMRARDGLGIQFLNRRNFDEARKAVRSAQPDLQWQP